MSHGPTSLVGVRIQGGLLPADLVSRIATGADVAGLRSDDFHLPAGESVRDAANRVWAYLRGAWTTYRQALGKLPDNDPATSLTRERFTLVLLEQLGYGRVPTTGKGGITVADQNFPVSHEWGCVPIHLLGRIPLDTRTKGAAGAAGASPQSMVQELLNRSDEHLWAILVNSTTLRLLRDSTSLVGSAYVEFDVDAIFDGDLFADFLLLYTLCHVSRVEPRDTEIGAASCWLEQWRQDAVESGSRALNLLRDGVIEALQTLGVGFLTHPSNTALRDDLAERRLAVDDVHHALLRVVYRLLFTFVAEDRGALLNPKSTPQARERYLTYFSTDRLRRTSRRRHGGRYGDKWEALTLVWRALGSVDGLPELGIPGIGGVFESGELDFLTYCSLSNQALQSAVRSLSVVREPRSGVLRVVDYRNLGAEELGSIYEALLEFVPRWDPATKVYELSIVSGNQRKDTGSYYTPTSLVESLLDTALEPVLDEAEKSTEPLEALLRVTVCDPACGSGHFLVGAARRIAKRVAALRTGDPEPAPEVVRSAMREVTGRCIYGVDVNPLAAELAKVSLWMEALEPGRPLTFLDAQIKVGNALVGTTPSLIAGGLPDDAFRPIEGDDRSIARALARQNRAERSAQDSLFDIDVVAANTELGESIHNVVALPALSLADIHVQQQRLRAYADSEDYRRQRLAADAWCAAFVWPKASGAPTAITHGTIVELAEGRDGLSERSRAEVTRLAAQYRFFHWHLEFPHIFPTTATGDDTVNPSTGWAGGFSAVIGNPPWERVKLQAQEFFAARDPEIAQAPNAAARKRLIAKLPETNPALDELFAAEKRRAEGISHLLRTSGRYPLAGRGDINTYAVFAESNRNLLGGHGRLGAILPLGIATDATTQYYFKDLVEKAALVSLFAFFEIRKFFIGTDDRNPFCLITIGGRNTHQGAASFAFHLQSTLELLRAERVYELTPEEITLLNPNTGTCPVFRTRRDAEITLGIYKRVPVLIRNGDPDGNPWGISFMTMFHMSNDSHLFHTRDELEADGWVLNGNVFKRGEGRMLPLYEAKMIHLYDTRWATYERDGTTRRMSDTEKAEGIPPIPRYWVAEREVNAKLAGSWNKSGFLGWRWVARSTDERTFIASLIPRVGAGNSLPLAISDGARSGLAGAWSSFALDFIARQKLGGTNMTFGTVQQLAVPPPGAGLASVHSEWVDSRFDRLNAWITDPDERMRIRAELDAYYFRLYGLNHDEVAYVMETFPIVKRKDIAAHGEYRTKRMILEIYDGMAEAEELGVPYVSPFDEVSAS
ncbi:Eco57I restriction-modification methylase domain-containing protein [Mycobacterium colombiense]|uniref:site-specific DNA-methyltransferase (adenine-specific) n=1 Tax=Mycobacterium colombiense TaxID=339268 RepID=A0A1A2Z6C1_9MYCO|nr:N-6 DNA methylase [Mycobacterium colombiense]OBI45203.1 restriction endonuclease [Mycobacterium colombiense]